MSYFLLEAPTHVQTVIHASYAPVEVRDMNGPVRITASHARAKILETKGQVDANAYVIDFAGSRGRIPLSAEAEINLRITASKFEGTLMAWAQRQVRMLVPLGFQTPFQAMVNRSKDFVDGMTVNSELIPPSINSICLVSVNQAFGLFPSR